MNPLAVLIGLGLGVVTAVACYVLSMITSGLFGRSFYRLYARVLIGTCSIMLLAPALRWLALVHPATATYGLTISQYLVAGVLFYGVYRFNRDHLKRLSTDRRTATFFAFGTLAYAAVVALVFLHVAITGTASWDENATGYVGVGNYGPLLILLAAMVFQTDYSLKQSSGDQRRFSRFSFLGYACSFVGLAFSMVPYVGNALRELELAALENQILQNFFSAQALLLAIVLYGWLVAKYESIPPLYLLLLAIVAEYHVLVSQWVVRSFGPESWGMASLPLFAGLVALDHYFTQWNQRKHPSRDAVSELPSNGQPRFYVPFRFVESGLAFALFAVTLWSRFLNDATGTDGWLIVTFSVYACFFAGMAVIRSMPRLLYVSGLLASLAILLGPGSVIGPLSTLLLSVFATCLALIAMLGERGPLKLSYRTPLVDMALLSGSIVTLAVLYRHLVGADAYHFQTVATLDVFGLMFAAITLLLCGFQYRSQVPVFGAIAAVSLIIPPWCAAVGLIATLSASLCKRSMQQEKARVLEDRCRLFGKIKMPLGSVLPELFVQPLSMGAIPLAILGWLISLGHVFDGNFSSTVMVGAVLSAMVLTWLARSYQNIWLRVSSFLATYFAIHTVAHGLVLQHWSTSEATAGHWFVAATSTLIAWSMATAYAAWCNAMLRRVAEDQEASYRRRRDNGAGLLFDMAFAAAIAVTLGIFATWISREDFSSLSTSLLFVAMAMVTGLFCHSATIYRSQVGSYLALTALTLTAALAPVILDLAAWKMSAVAAAGLTAAIASFLAYGRRENAEERGESKPYWKRPLPYFPATGFELWYHPLGFYGMAGSAIAVLLELGFDAQTRSIEVGLSIATPLTLAFAGIAYLFSTRAFRMAPTYLIGIVLLTAAAHTFIVTVTDRWIDGDNWRYVQLFTAAGLSCLGCCVSAVFARRVNLRISSADSEFRSRFIELRAYYAGLLQHVSLAYAMVVLLCLLPLVMLGREPRAAQLWLNVGTSFLIAIAFSLSGKRYWSRLPTYAALTAFCLGLVNVVSISTQSFALEYWIITISAIGLACAMAGRALQRRSESREAPAIEYGRRRIDCWESPPWPWVSTKNSLWSVPLAQFSILLSLLAVGLTVFQFANGDLLGSQWWLHVLPIYFSSGVFIVCTRMHDVGLAALLVPEDSTDESDALQRWASRRAERAFYFVTCLILFTGAVHLTLHLTFLSSELTAAALSWHFMFASVLSVFGWAGAAVYVNQIKNSSSQIQTQSREDDLIVYGGTLHYVSAFGALLLLAAALMFGVPPYFLSVPSLVGLGLLTLAFGLNSVTFRSQLAAYLALLTVGLTTVHIGSWIMASYPSLAPSHAPILASLAIGLMVLSRWALRQAAGDASMLEHQQSDVRETGAAIGESQPWRATGSWKLERVLSIWTRPLRESSLLCATAGLAVMLLHRWVWNDTWNAANPQALVTYSCVAITFALGARLYNAAALTYLAAIVFTFSAIPQMLIFGVPVSHQGAGLATVALAFWVAGYLCERIAGRQIASGNQENSESIERIYERPLIRSSAVLAILAIVHSLYVWKTYGWTVSQFPIVCACAFGSVTLLLNARSLNVLHRVTRARTLVYLACASVTGCALAVTSAASDFNGLGPVSAVTALLLGAIALVLNERSRAVEGSDTSLAESRLTFGEPISHSAALLAMLAVVVSLIAIAGSLGTPGEWIQASTETVQLSDIPLLPAAVTLLVSSVVFLLTVRTNREMQWLYPFTILGTFGLLMLGQTQFGWDLGTLAIVSLGLMNALVIVARLIRVRSKSVESILGLSEARCDAAFYQWPLLFATMLLVAQAVLAAYGVFETGSALQYWPWLWVSLLSSLVFLHVLSFEGKPAYIHLVVWAAVTGVLGYSVAGDLTLNRDELVVAVGFGWGAMALALLAGTFTGRDRLGEMDTSTPNVAGLQGTGNSLLTIGYLVGSGIAIAPVALSSQATSVGIALGCISLCWLWMSWISRQEVLGYATLLGMFATVLFLAHGVLGTSLIGNPYSAFFIVGYSFLLYGVNTLVTRLNDSNFQVFLRPTYYLALALPITLVVAIPMDQRAPAALALMAAGAFYLLVARQSQVRWALYVAAGCANVAIYLWIPVAREATGLFQLYVIPAAITVLIFAQLHRHELNSQVLTSIRLAAAGAILAVSTFEVFFAKDTGLMQFVLVLLFSLAGTATGIALRVKPFVYVGVAFLIINVLGQLGLQFQHQGGVIRAVILIGLGLAILAIMIFFNVHRERILHTYRGFVADKSWE